MNEEEIKKVIKGTLQGWEQLGTEEEIKTVRIFVGDVFANIKYRKGEVKNGKNNNL